MGDYEELVELGIEGVDKVVDKFHDKAFDKVGKHSPSWHRRNDRRQQQQQQQAYQNPPAEQSSRDGSKAPTDRRSSRIEGNMYAPERRQERDFQIQRDPRYVSDETFYYRGPDAGAVMMRDSGPYNKALGYEVQEPQQLRYDDRRPQPQRRRSSWSPQRSGRDRGHDRRARSKSRSRSRSRDKQDRILATVAGGLIGGLLANQARKGKKYDTAATVVGAVVGGLGAREATDFWEKKKAQREDSDERRDERHDDSRDRRRDDRDGRRRDDRDGLYEDRYDTHYDHRRRYDDRY